MRRAQLHGILRRIACAMIALTSFFALPVLAQSYPSKPIRFIVPFPPGGGTDVIGRLLAQKLTAALGQQFIVDNRVGAAGRLGTEYVAHAAPDGYTLLMTTTTTIITAPALFAKLPYQSPQDFAPIGPIVTGAMVLVVHPSVPARSVKALIALAKQRSGQLNFASTGPGDTNHLAAELFQIRAGVQMVHVPYRGAAPATLSVVMGETGLMFSNIVPVMPPLKSGKVMPLGITSLAPSPMPNQQIRTSTNQFPEEEEDKQVSGKDDAQHCKCEQTQQAEITSLRFVADHIASRIDVHERGNAYDHQRHYERVVVQQQC